MRRSSILVLTAALLALPALAKPAYVSKAKAAGIDNASCTTCHVKMGSKELNKVGEVAKATTKDGSPDFAAVKKAMK